MKITPNPEYKKADYSLAAINLETGEIVELCRYRTLEDARAQRNAVPRHVCEETLGNQNSALVTKD